MIDRALAAGTRLGLRLVDGPDGPQRRTALMEVILTMNQSRFSEKKKNRKTKR